MKNKLRMREAFHNKWSWRSKQQKLFLPLFIIIHVPNQFDLFIFYMSNVKHVIFLAYQFSQESLFAYLPLTRKRKNALKYKYLA